MTSNEHDVLDHLTYEAGVADIDEELTAAADQRWAHDLVHSYQGPIAAARRALLPPDVRIEQAEPIRPSLLALTREALLARLAALSAAYGPNLQYAYRVLIRASDDDLRRLVQTLEPTADE